MNVLNRIKDLVSFSGNGKNDGEEPPHQNLVEEKTQLIKQKKELEEELLQIKDTLSLKNELLMNISQELRSSFSLIQGPFENLDEISADTLPDWKHRIQNIKKNILRFDQIIEQLWDVSRLQAQNMDLEVTEIEVCTFLRRYLAFFESKAQQKGIDLQADLPDYEIIQTVDPDKFEKIIIILISNAIRYTLENGEVLLTLKDTEQQVEISVKDTGKGMSEEMCKNLFYQPDADSAATINANKAGIRLSIAKKYVEMHNGTISVESKKGDGTIFKLIFPKESETLKNAKTKDFDVDRRTWFAEEQETTEELSPIYSKNDANAKVLVVEDNRDMREYIVELLNAEGLHIDIASNGKEAQKQLSVSKPDLIISDIMMPEVDGFEFVEKIRAQSRFQLIPVILISAKADTKDRIHGFNIGINDYLVKPFDESELKARVRNLLTRKKEREKYYSDIETDAVNDEKSLIEKLESYVESRVKNENITIKELAQSVNLSRRQLYRDIKAFTGFTPAEFVREVKLLKARQMLQQKPKITVAEVANAVGYSTVTHFSKIFKKRFGRNPSKYK